MTVSARYWSSLLCGVIASCVVICTEVCAAVQTSPSAGPEHTIVVRLVDMAGKPVEGAHVGDYSDFGKQSEQPADESGWHYWPHAVSDSDGMARISDDYESLDCVVARHVGRKLTAIQDMNPEQSNEIITVTMQPQCRVFGQLVSKELEAHNRRITWSNVYLYSGKARPLGCSSKEADFHFYVPAGTYRLNAYGIETYEVNRTVTVQSGQQELEIEPINMPPKQWVLLEGQLAPALQDIVAWKNGGPINLSELRGKVVILEFWGYWCGPCMGQMLKLMSIYDRYHEQGLVIIGIHLDVGQTIDSAAKLDEKLTEIKRTLWNDRDVPFPIALVLEHKVPFRPDVDRKACCPLAAKYGIDSLPTGILIDRQGRLVGRFRAGYKPDQVVLEKILKEK